MMSFQTDWLVNLTLSALIITGGLGFMVWFDLATKARNQSGRRTLRFHTKVVLWLTAAILLFGTVTSLLTEFDNPATIGSLPLGEKIFGQLLPNCQHADGWSLPHWIIQQSDL